MALLFTVLGYKERMTGSHLHLHTELLEQLGADIVSGVVPVGSVVSAEELSGRFGVSRTVVREAVRVLESMNLLDVRRRKGMTVQPAAAWNSYDQNLIRWQLAGPQRLQQLSSLGELRQAVEPLAARLAAVRATPAHCGELTGAVIGMSATARAADAETYLAHDIAFHRTLLAASGNPMFSCLGDVVAAVLTGRTRHRLMPRVANAEAVALHADVASAVQAGDTDSAESAMTRIVHEAAAAIDALGAATDGRQPA